MDRDRTARRCGRPSHHEPSASRLTSAPRYSTRCAGLFLSSGTCREPGGKWRLHRRRPQRAPLLLAPGRGRCPRRCRMSRGRPTPECALSRMQALPVPGPVRERRSWRNHSGQPCRCRSRPVRPGSSSRATIDDRVRRRLLAWWQERQPTPRRAPGLRSVSLLGQLHHGGLRATGQVARTACPAPRVATAPGSNSRTPATDSEP